MPVLQYQKNEGRQVSQHFSSTEFDCPCQHCGVTLVDSELAEKLDAMRNLLGVPMIITSGYRCAAYQADLKARGYETAKGISQHTLGKAADLTNHIALGIELEGFARQAGFRAVGRGSNWVHVDTRSDTDRSWTYRR